MDKQQQVIDTLNAETKRARKDLDLAIRKQTIDWSAIDDVDNFDEVGYFNEATERALEAEIEYRRAREEREEIFALLGVDPATRNDLPARKAARNAINQKTETSELVMPAETRWGQLLTNETVAEGIALITTASQGGFCLTAARNEMIPKAFKAVTCCGDGIRGFYEEERDWAIVVYCFREYFTDEDYARALKVMAEELDLLAPALTA